MANDVHELTLSFDGTDVAEANRFAAELADRLRDADPSISVQLARNDPDAQDFGGTLVLVLGTKAVVALAGGLAAWLAMRPNAKVTLKGKDGTIIAGGLKSADARAIVEERLAKPSR